MHMSTPKKKKLIWRIILCMLALLALYIICTAVSIVRYGSVDEKAQSDAAIILGAGTWNGEVSPVYRERLNHGIWLYQNGYVQFLIVTGGTGEGSAVSDAQAAKEYVLSQGVPEDVILLEERSTITEENLEYSKAIMEEKGLSTAIIVSDPLHMKRAMLMAKDYGLAACPSPTPTTMYKSFKTKAPFLAREIFFYTGYCIVRIFR